MMVPSGVTVHTNFVPGPLGICARIAAGIVVRPRGPIVDVDGPARSRRLPGDGGANVVLTLRLFAFHKGLEDKP